MDSLTGCFLVAAPTLVDPNFHRTVVLIVQHDADGAMGLVINRPLEATVAQVWKQVSEVPCPNQDPIHQGGPCEGPLMVLHQESTAAQMQMALPGQDHTTQLCFSTHEDHLRQLIEGNVQPSKFFVGYAGWSAGQLEKELATGSWLVTPASAPAVFTPPPDQWEELVRRIGRAQMYSQLNPRIVPPDPTVN